MGMDWIIGGTKDLRDFIELLKKSGENLENIIVSTASDYGKKLVENMGVLVHAGAMDEEQMKDFVLEKNIKRIFDFSHPYAVEVSKNAMRIAEKFELEYFRFERAMIKYENYVSFYEIDELVKFLENLQGNILVTLGSNNIERFKNLKNLENIYFRVLPVTESLQKMENIGIKAKNIIGLQGPFSKEFNMAIYKNYQIKYVVTKESGKTGGELEKIEACYETKAIPIVLKRPKINYSWKSSDINILVKNFKNIN